MKLTDFEIIAMTTGAFTVRHYTPATGWVTTATYNSLTLAMEDIVDTILVQAGVENTVGLSLDQQVPFLRELLNDIAGGAVQIREGV